MKARSIVPHVLMIVLMAGAMWAASPSRASAQPLQFPPGCSQSESCLPQCPTEPEGTPFGCIPAPGAPPVCIQEDFSDCAVEVAVYTPTQNSHVFIFDPNNSIQITVARVRFPFVLEVERIPTDQATYATRVAETDFEGSTCNLTFPPVTSFECAVFKVHGDLVS